MRSDEEQVVRKLAGLGFSEADARTLADHFLEAERRGKQGHGLSRVEWLTGFPGLDPARAPRAACAREHIRALGRKRRARLPHAGRDRRGAARIAAGRGAARRGAALLPDRDARLLGAQARRRWPRRRSDRDVTAAAGPSRRRAEAGRHEPACDRDSELGREAGRRGRLDGRGHLRRRASPERLRRSSSSRSAGSTRTRRSHSRSGCSCSSTRSWPSPATARSCSSPGRRRTRCRRYEPAPLVCDCPVIARKRASS